MISEIKDWIFGHALTYIHNYLIEEMDMPDDLPSACCGTGLRASVSPESADSLILALNLFAYLAPLELGEVELNFEHLSTHITLNCSHEEH